MEGIVRVPARGGVVRMMSDVPRGSPWVVCWLEPVIRQTLCYEKRNYGSILPIGT